MRPPTTRPARAEDAPAITALVQAAYAPYLTRMPRRPAPMDDDYTDVIATADVWVVERRAEPEPTGPRRHDSPQEHDSSQEIIGVVVLRPGNDHLLVDNLAVHPSAQGSGVGTHLLHLVDEIASTAGLHEIRLYTNVAMTENLAFYPRHGYVETHRGWDDGYERAFFTRTP